MYTACGKEIRVEGGGGYRDREYGRVRDDGGRGIPAFVEAETTVAALETRMPARLTFSSILNDIRILQFKRELSLPLSIYIFILPGCTIDAF
jgi:hypothetical protein